MRKTVKKTCKEGRKEGREEASKQGMQVDKEPYKQKPNQYGVGKQEYLYVFFEFR